MNPALILFDIDGTLLLSGRAGLRAMTRAFADTFGITDAFEGRIVWRPHRFVPGVEGAAGGRLARYAENHERFRHDLPRRCWPKKLNIRAPATRD